MIHVFYTFEASEFNVFVLIIGPYTFHFLNKLKMPSHISAKNSPSSPSLNHVHTNQAQNTTANVSSFSIVQNSSKSFEEMNLIGNGAYGTVYKAKDLAHHGRFVALKKVRIFLEEDGVPVSTIREISVLKQLTALEHPNVVRLLDICHGRKLENERQMLVYLVFEHIDQDLATFLERCPSPGISPDRIKDIIYQLLRALDFLHSNRVLHRDLKPQNILISNQGIVKVADFGLARFFESHNTLTSVVVTLWYRPPEVLLSQAYGTAVDIWSCGCILAELYKRKPLFPGENEVDQLGKIFGVIGCPPQSKWPNDVSLSWSTFKFYKGVNLENVVPEICKEGVDLLKSMLRFDPMERPTCADAMKHPYFQDFNRNSSSNLNNVLYSKHQSKTFKVSF